MKKYLSLLSDLVLFKSIPYSHIDTLLTVLKAQKQLYTANEIVLHAGQVTGRFGIVLEGNVHILKEDYQGNVILLAQLKSGDLFAEAFVCAKTPLTVTVQAMKDAVILWIDYKALRRQHTPNHEMCAQLTDNLIGILAGKNVFLTGRIEHLSKRTLREKVMSYLNEQALRSGKRYFFIPLNRQELADYLAADRSALSAVLSKLRHEGVIDFYKNEFTLLKD